MFCFWFPEKVVVLLFFESKTVFFQHQTTKKRFLGQICCGNWFFAIFQTYICVFFQHLLQIQYLRFSFSLRTRKSRFFSKQRAGFERADSGEQKTFLSHADLRCLNPYICAMNKISLKSDIDTWSWNNHLQLYNVWKLSGKYTQFFV